jgi:hypothetical protein
LPSWREGKQQPVTAKQYIDIVSQTYDNGLYIYMCIYICTCACKCVYNMYTVYIYIYTYTHTLHIHYMYLNVYIYIYSLTYLLQRIHCHELVSGKCPSHWLPQHPQDSGKNRFVK